MMIIDAIHKFLHNTTSTQTSSICYRDEISNTQIHHVQTKC